MKREPPGAAEGPTEAAVAEPVTLPTNSAKTTDAARPPREHMMHTLTPSERALLGLYHMITAKERNTAPPSKEISPEMAKTHVLPSEAFAYNQKCKHEAKEFND